MPLLNTRKIKDTLFGMLYVMRDGNKKPSQTAMRDLTILFLIDMGQVLRVLMSPFYGWNKATYDVAKHIDIVYNFTKLMSFLVPRYTFFGIAFILVVVAIGDAFYCAKLFKAGDISKIGPVKALRFLVALVVTTLFSSVMKWLLIPLECLASHEKSLSSYIHGEDAPCTPWMFPEIVATIPTLVVVVVYVFFAFTATFFSVCTNPLAFAPNVQATGRVEALFLTSKVLATFLVFLSEYITPVATTTVLFILNLIVLFRHLTVLPFHSHATNLLRGGIYFCISWLSFASLVVAAIGSNELVEDDIFQTTQWMLVGFLPVSFTIGIWITHYRRASLLLSLDRLRGEYESYQLQGADSNSQSSYTPKPSAKFLPPEQPQTPGTGGIGVKNVARNPRNAYDNFFDPSWERKRAFSSGLHAHTIARTLLMQRQESDLPFLAYIMTRSVEEHADSEMLQIFRISLLRFVFRNTQEAAAEEKKLKGLHKALSLDHEYILYAVERKASQDYAASNMGNGTYNAINLMEFDSGMQTARTAHMACIVEMKKFWQAVSSKRKKLGFESQVGTCITRLVEFNKAQERAEAEYHALLEKYPQSVQLLQAYATFCDTVNNDVKRAEGLRKQASAMEGDDESESAGGDRRPDNGDAMSAATSEHETFRLRTLRAFSQWSELIWGQEWTQLVHMNRRVRFFCVALLLVSVGGFLTLQLWLFESIAQRDVHLINMTGLLRAWAISSCFLLRTQFLKSLAGDVEGAAKAAGTVATLSGRLQAQHWDNYEIIRTQKVRDYYLEPSLDLMVPSGLGWNVHTYTFWAFGTDWTRRMERASQTSVEELQASTDWSVRSISEGQLNMQFLYENAFRAGIPAFESIVKLYEVEMQALWGLTQTIVLVATIANVVIQLIIGVLVVWGVRRTIQKMQHMAMACMLAIQLPAVTSKKLAQFYKDAEAEMRCVEDEEEERRRIIEEPEPTTPVTPTALGFKRRTSGDSFVSRNSAKSGGDRGDNVKTLSTENLEKFKQEAGRTSPLRVLQRRESHRGVRSPVRPMRSPSRGIKKPAVDSFKNPRRVSLASDCVVGHEAVVLDDTLKEKAGSDNDCNDVTEEEEDTWSAVHGHAELVYSERKGLGDLQDDEESDEGREKPLVPRPLENGAEEEEEEELEAGWHSLQVDAVLVDEGAGVWGSSSSGSRQSATETEAEKEDRREKQRVLRGRWEGIVGGVKKEQTTRRHQMVVSLPSTEEEEEEEVEITAHAPIATVDEEAKAVGNGHAAGWRGSNGSGVLKPPRAPPPLHMEREEEEGVQAEAEEEEEDPAEVARQDALAEKVKRSKVAMSPKIGAIKKPKKGDDDGSSSSDDIPPMPASVSFKVPHSPQTRKVGFFQGFFNNPSGSIKDIFSGSGRSEESGSHRDDESTKDDEVELLPLNDVPDSFRDAIRNCLQKEWPLAVRTSVHLLAVLICVGLSILNTSFPTRKMHQLVTLAPTINQAGRRRFLTRSCVHLARELVLDDGFSRMNKVDTASALNYYLNELKVANDAVRLGGALDISVGADYRNPLHNEIMYGEGCPWREDPSDCSTPERPGAAASGLYHLSLSFFDAIQSVLIRFGPDPSEYRDDFLTNPRLNVNDFTEFETVKVDPNRTKLLAEDPELVFILNGFAGDMFTGFALLVEVFDQELRDIVQSASSDNETIFIVYMIAMFGGFYLILFRRAVGEAKKETVKARDFVARIPSYTLSQLEIDTVASIFSHPQDV